MALDRKVQYWNWLPPLDLNQEAKYSCLPSPEPPPEYKNIAVCASITQNDLYLLSSSGPAMTLWQYTSKQGRGTFKPVAKQPKIYTPDSPSVVCTCLAFQPGDNNVIALGLLNGDVVIYSQRRPEGSRLIRSKESPHKKRITSLDFINPELTQTEGDHSITLASASADVVVTLWKLEHEAVGTQYSASALSPLGRSLELDPEKKESECVPVLSAHKKERKILISRPSKLSIYDYSTQTNLFDFEPNTGTRIQTATYSRNFTHVYCALDNGNIVIFNDKLEEQDTINMKALPTPYPRLDAVATITAIVSHPEKNNQFSIGCSTGLVYVCDIKC